MILFYIISMLILVVTSHTAEEWEEFFNNIEE